ncbi:MAG: cysteine desulfurase family protein [Halanaerobium sp. 4-GBenrich]|jgi:cysteine desulfurase|uniref:cysteine desulfurase n=1 Tax=Halanaerobium congolense TaxID=54121 RepID=A0A1G6K7W0_9FIRM|nr:cysteine desulfurase family protein [Halanaerobium congolense]KXS47530.1 MAG: cysteine desulfurase family protein [Halanaerobium sp. T82-1]ODS50576.1 MAG: cysteine desulfurase family protein [Halanaerobium sp. 4-GBenrich]PUU91483.1 MAG: cysteine desulfurase family protein [Halanaerobium sp.]TDS26380.1 cysteine desulfurase [Halanaerobium congolense]SDC26968.1 cysteine desulfurase [Halanaerobium congolense]
MIYLDYNATTPIDKKVAEAMEEYIYGNFGNPSSSHELGSKTKQAVEEARKKVASLLNASPEEIIFTSGGSESNNMVLKGVGYTYQNRGKHIITSEIEHPAVISPCKFLEGNGYEVTYLSVDQDGVVDIEQLKAALTDETILISIMHANNETGTIQPLAEIAEIVSENNILLHTDAAQSVGKIETDVKKLGVDFLSVAGHKVYAPKGIGALYIRAGIEIEPLIHGAGHEMGKRAGTENVIFDVALGKACELAEDLFQGKKADFEHNTPGEIKELRDYFQKQLQKNFKDRVILNGHPTKRLPNTLNISFLDYSGQEILDHLDNVALSTGSACHSDLVEISSVLKAMSVTMETGRGAVRFSLGKYTTRDEIEHVLDKLESLREL